MARLNENIELRLDNKKLLMLLLGIMAVGASIFVMGFWAGQASRSPGKMAQATPVKSAPLSPSSPAPETAAPTDAPADAKPATAGAVAAVGDAVGKVIANADGLEIEPVEDDKNAPKTATTVVFPDSLTAKEVKEDFKAGPKTEVAPKAIETQPAEAKPETKPETKEDAPANPWAMKKAEGQPSTAVPTGQPETAQPAAAKTPEPEKKAAPSGGGSAFVIQIASSQDLAQAQKKVDELVGMGFAGAEVQSADIPGKGLWHRAIIGGYATKDAAQKDVAKVAAKCKCKPMVRAR